MKKNVNSNICSICNKPLYPMKFEKDLFGCTNNHIWEVNSNGSIRQLTYIDSKVEYFIELPFNLALKTGLYTFDVAKQIKVRRDMYYIQKLNPIENPSSKQWLILDQKELFNNNGLCKEKYSEYSFKRKMKTIIFLKYNIPLYTNLTEDQFKQHLRQGNFRYPKGYVVKIKQLKDRFYQQINEFLEYYSNYFTINNPNFTMQYEVGALSIYEFDKQISGSIFRYGEIAYFMHQIIEDYTNLVGIPEFTYINDDKFEEFEKIMENRNNYPILPHQQMFNLAKRLWRSHKTTMRSTIISTSITAIESLLYQLEIIDESFKALKNMRSRWILSGYFNVFCYYKRFLKPKCIRNNKIIKIRLAKIVHKEYINNTITLKQCIRFIRYLNYARLIRNGIIHKGIFRYNEKKDFIRFNLLTDTKNSTLIKKIKFSELWRCLLLFYNALNNRLMKKIYPDINWTIPIIYKETVLATSVDTSIGDTVPIVPNYDWREIDFYKMNPADFIVPPDRFPKAIRTINDEIMVINPNCINNHRFEMIQQKEIENDGIDLRFLTFQTNLNHDEFIQLAEEKRIDHIFDSKGNYFYKSCNHCGYPLHINRYAEYNNNICSQCNEKFDLFDLLYNVCNIYLSNRNHELAMKYAYLSIKCIKYSNHENSFGLGEIFLKLGVLEMAKLCFFKSFQQGLIR